MKEMKNKINNWDECSIADYRKIADIFANEELDEIEKTVGAIAVIKGVEEEDVWSLSLDEINSINMDWLGKFDFDKKKNYKKKIEVGGYKCNVMVNLQEMTVSQYVDFQNYWKQSDRAKYMPYILSVFIIPEGKKYSEGYNIEEFIQAIDNEVSIVESQSICFFFLKKLRSSILSSMISWKLLMKMMKKRNLSKEAIEKINQMEKMMEELNGYF